MKKFFPAFKFLLLLFLITCPMVNIASDLYFKKPRINNLADKWQIVFDANRGPFQLNHFTLQHPSRYVIDIANANMQSKLSDHLFRGLPINTIRVGHYHHKLRLVVELNNVTIIRSYIMKPAGKRGYRLVIELAKSKSMLKAYSHNSSAITVKKSTINNSPDALKKQLNTQETDKKKKANNVVVPEHYRASSDVIVVIDAGHGGKDPGATGPSGYHEKNVVFHIARDLQRAINQVPGFKAYLTRTGDYYLYLRQRLKIARKDHADMFISIHADAAPRGENGNDAEGASVFALSQHGATSEAARWLAERENQSELIGGVDLSDKSHMLRSVLLDLSQTATIRTSLQIGHEVVNALGTVVPLHRGRRVEQAAFVVLKSPDIPSLLVETGFITNPQQEKELVNPLYQMKIAHAISLGITEYFESHPPPGTFLAENQRDINYQVKSGDTLTALAAQYGVSEKIIMKLNRLVSSRLKIGQKLLIPLHR